MFRTVLKSIGGGLLLIVLLLVLGTVVPRPFFAGDASGVRDREILLLSNPIHTDIALPVDDDLRRVFSELQEGGIAVNHPAAAYLVFGWGGRSFYTETPTWADLKPMPVLRSLTLDRSVMHVDVTGDFPADLAGVKRLRISEAGYRRLVTAIRASFLRDDGRDGGKVRLISGVSYGLTDAFFEAKGWFNALAGCNTWSAAMLQEAGIRTGWWTPLPLLLRWSATLHN
ncbi:MULTISPECIES: TIGR02117 family protein [unclassified Agrobacterium]|uniref:TIGR02117 family protein n=1 Tax=unclassified Agrobacterium TaxID=2632611 RepID=UPI00244CAD93|nr:MULTISPECIES: TIGR02117 family protein [unclassified Agrobacterium]MDH0615787.1 TIGR02117 family protein [Agrobacterium sp. GD03872]MDH0697860.1 TIGR02117 family protein [Agrobacterium sp. GD03871]MDH1061720.1 TIGR02117 family protein [Agrobacterium sp. GD03992]MDH2211179.1 TIGR02117 family protein [Agrobacterium sp. GD03643]MDH2221676.1 TIGR02117 family protein [Agrobacterium sp. GD03638]